MRCVVVEFHCCSRLYNGSSRHFGRSGDVTPPRCIDHVEETCRRDRPRRRKRRFPQFRWRDLRKSPGCKSQSAPRPDDAETFAARPLDSLSARRRWRISFLTLTIAQTSPPRSSRVIADSIESLPAQPRSTAPMSGRARGGTFGCFAIPPVTCYM